MAPSFRLPARRIPRTSAHSRLPLANLRKARGMDDHPPNRIAMVRGSCFPSSRYPRCEGTSRFLRTASPQSRRSSLSWICCAPGVRGFGLAALTASFHLGKNFQTEYLDIPAREMNSARDGARPSRLAMAPIESNICCLPVIGSLSWRSVRPDDGDLTQRRNCKSRSTIIWLSEGPLATHVATLAFRGAREIRIAGYPKKDSNETQLLVTGGSR